MYSLCVITYKHFIPDNLWNNIVLRSYKTPRRRHNLTNQTFSNKWCRIVLRTPKTNLHSYVANPSCCARTQSPSSSDVVALRGLWLPLISFRVPLQYVFCLSFNFTTSNPLESLFIRHLSVFFRACRLAFSLEASVQRLFSIRFRGFSTLNMAWPLKLITPVPAALPVTSCCFLSWPKNPR